MIFPAQVLKSVEQKKAKLVVIAHDVEPIEIILVLPALCRKMGVPYVIVKGKGKLGQYVHRKKCTALSVIGEWRHHFQLLRFWIFLNFLAFSGFLTVSFSHFTGTFYSLDRWINKLINFQ